MNAEWIYTDVPVADWHLSNTFEFESIERSTVYGWCSIATWGLCIPLDMHYSHELSQSEYSTRWSVFFNWILFEEDALQPEFPIFSWINLHHIWFWYVCSIATLFSIGADQSSSWYVWRASFQWICHTYQKNMTIMVIIESNKTNTNERGSQDAKKNNISYYLSFPSLDCFSFFSATVWFRFVVYRNHMDSIWSIQRKLILVTFATMCAALITTLTAESFVSMLPWFVLHYH